MHLPGWDSLERVTTLHSFFEIAGIVALALLVLFEVCGYVYGHRRDTLRENTLAAQVGPRRLSTDQRGTLVQRLSQRPSVVVISSRLMDAEGAAYATDFEEVFHKAGWEAARNGGLVMNFTGLGLGVADPAHPPANAEMLGQALTESGLQWRFFRHDELHSKLGFDPASDLTILLVGAK